MFCLIFWSVRILKGIASNAIKQVKSTMLIITETSYLTINIKNLPALAGIVHGVVVQIAKPKLGMKSSSSLHEVVLETNLKMAYMLFETWPSGYWKQI